MNYVFISANYAAFLIAKNAAPLVPFLLHSKLPKVVYSDLPITGFFLIHISFEISIKKMKYVLPLSFLTSLHRVVRRISHIVVCKFQNIQYQDFRVL